MDRGAAPFAASNQHPLRGTCGSGCPTGVLNRHSVVAHGQNARPVRVFFMAMPVCNHDAMVRGPHPPPHIPALWSAPPPAYTASVAFQTSPYPSNRSSKPFYAQRTLSKMLHTAPFPRPATGPSNSWSSSFDVVGNTARMRPSHPPPGGTRNPSSTRFCACSNQPQIFALQRAQRPMASGAGAACCFSAPGLPPFPS